MSELTKDQLGKLAKVLKVNACPNCGSTKHKDSVLKEFHLMSHGKEDRDLILEKSPEYIPLLACSCPDCGYTMLFNLKALGVVDE